MAPARRAARARDFRVRSLARPRPHTAAERRFADRRDRGANRVGVQPGLRGKHSLFTLSTLFFNLLYL